MKMSVKAAVVGLTLSLLFMASAGTAALAEGMSDGKFQGTGTGIEGDVVVEITVENGAINDIAVVEDNETAGVGAKALGIIAEEVVAGQSLAVDSVAGATISSAAMKSAIGNAIREAGGDADEWKSREIEVEAVDEVPEASHKQQQRNICDVYRHKPLQKTEASGSDLGRDVESLH